MHDLDVHDEAAVGRYEVIFALPVFIPFEDGYAISAGPYGADDDQLTRAAGRQDEP
jgi:hypothetical protein